MATTAGSANGEPVHAPNEPVPSARLGRIPVRNVWLLMLYASELFRTRGKEAVEIDTPPDKLPDMLAEILTRAARQRIGRGLSVAYRPREAPLRRVRGRIDTLATERGKFLERAKVACRFHDLVVDTPRNRFVRSALELLARMVSKEALAGECRRLAGQLTAMGVAAPAPSLREIGNERFGHHDRDDRHMVAAARLVFEMAIPSETRGAHMLDLPDRDEHWLRRLFEKAIAGLYDAALSPAGWNVRAGTRIAWPLGARSDGLERILPGMKTDIVLDHAERQRRIVIDTKFTHLLGSGWYRKESLRSSHLYQMYAYLRSQEGNGEGRVADEAEGILLHPCVGKHIDEFADIQGHRIRFVTVDLTAEPSAIRAELISLVEGEDAGAC